ncbi:DUF6716 putative glycosyltransferase [Streptomyces sp. NPDC093801]|uniref:DUF6716 putative glycosyltransferase n=1 Tax=Streptomyces sp. NPDC093801 TaxID=3155203 RepID=UPI00344C4999
MPVPLRRSPADQRIAVLADSDTRWKWGVHTARRLLPSDTPAGHRITGYLLRGRATPTARQLGEAGAGADAAPVEVTCAEFLAELGREHHDVVVLALVGGAVQAALHGARALWPEPSARPVFVTGYVGVVYEKLADGLLLRHGADLVLANSRHDAERFRAVYAGVGADPDAVTETALPFLAGAPYEPAGTRTHRVVFAVQPSVPESRADRAYLLERAAAHARLHPDREVLVKLRSRPGEHTTHLEEHPYQRLAERLPGGLPPNCRLVYGHMGEVLDGTGLLVTVSSTAALESLHRGIPTAVLTDLGIREALGNQHFLGSGCLASWNQLDAGLLPRADPAWLAAHGVPAAGPAGPGPDPCDPDPYARARERVAGLLAKERLAPVAPYYTAETAPGYLPGILARQHLAPDGTPLPGALRSAQGRSAARRWVRGRLREAARGAYRHGVQRVAPAIRRLGEL